MQFCRGLIEEEDQNIDTIFCEIRNIFKGEEISNGNSVNFLQMRPKPIFGSIFFIGGEASFSHP